MVTTILFDHIHIKEPQELLKTQHRLIENIVMGRLRAPNVKKLVGFTYHGEDVYRARINDVDRLIYTYIDYQGQRTLLLLVVQTNHNYNQTKRLLDGINPQMVPIDLKDREADESSLELKHDLDSESTEGSELALVPAYPYKHQYLVLDEEQDRAMKLHAPILLSGPPGSGKTAVLYNILLNALPGLAEQVRTLGITDGEVLFISQSQPLIQTLNDAYIHDAPETPFAVGFTTWNTLLQQHYPDSRLVTSDDFALWLSQQKHEEPVEQLHYELSIIAGLGPDEYLRLGQRQSYCAGNQKRQKELIVFLSLWEHHLQEQGGIDPMTTKLPRSANPRYLTVYCDETQNLPPVALLYLMAQAQQRQFIACLDSEQCLLSSPFILSIIKKMMYLVYQLQDREFLLPRTWRCPPIVAKVANHLMDSKHRLHKESDEALRRPYREIISARNLAEKGLVSLFNDKNAARLHELASSPKTVIIVEQLTPAIREAINTCLNSNNILTAKMAIGLDFKNVILWHPIQETSLIALAKGKKVTGLSLAQLNTFNALYVAITRAEANVLIIEDYDRFQPLIQAIFGHELAKNQLPIDLENLSPEQQRQEWLKQVEFHLSQDRLDLARSIMGFHLKMNKAQIDEFCKDRKRAMEPQRLPKAVEVSAAPAAPISKRQKPHPNPKKPMLDSKAPAPALAPKAKRASPEELKAKIAAYISNLLQNLSRIAETADSPAQEALLKEQTSNLRSLINHPRSEEFLFEPFLVDGSLLFVHLLTLNNPRLSDLAFRTLIPQKPHLISRIAQPATFLLQAKIEPFFPTVFYLFSTHNGTRAILLLLAQNKNLIEIVTPELLYKKVNGISAFFNLASFPKGQEYLLYLFSEKPSLIASLSEEDLYQAPSELEDDYTNSSPFFWCCSSGSEKGPDLLDLIYKTKPILLDALKSSMLAKEYKGNVPCLLSMTPISVLIAIKKYDFLKMLVHRKPVLFSELSLDWIVDRRNDVRPEYRESILALCFIDIEYSFEFLEYFIRYNRKFLEKITLEFLLERRMGTDTEFNLLYHCSWSANGVDLLTLIIGYNPLLGSAISSEHLNTVFLNQSILFILTTQYKGIKLLQRLSHLNQNLSVNLLVTQLDQQTFQDTPLVNLLLSKAGVELLVLWLTQNPLLAKDIVLENLERGLITNEKLLTQITKIINPPNYNKLLSILCPLNQHAAELIADYIEPAANTSGDRRALSSRFFAPESDVKKEEDTLLQYPKPF